MSKFETCFVFLANFSYTLSAITDAKVCFTEYFYRDLNSSGMQAFVYLANKLVF